MKGTPVGSVGAHHVHFYWTAPHSPPTGGETEASRHAPDPKATGRAGWTRAHAASCFGPGPRRPPGPLAPGSCQPEGGAHFAHAEALTSDLLCRGWESTSVGRGVRALTLTPAAGQLSPRAPPRTQVRPPGKGCQGRRASRMPRRQAEGRQQAPGPGCLLLCGVAGCAAWEKQEPAGVGHEGSQAPGRDREGVHRDILGRPSGDRGWACMRPPGWRKAAGSLSASTAGPRRRLEKHACLWQSAPSHVHVHRATGARLHPHPSLCRTKDTWGGPHTPAPPHRAHVGGPHPGPSVGSRSRQGKRLPSANKQMSGSH